MDTRYDTKGASSGLSTGHLLFVFLVGVAVCAVFFSLGYLVGYNERSLKEVLTSERVETVPVASPPAAAPPAVAASALSETVIGTRSGEPAASGPVKPGAGKPSEVAQTLVPAPAGAVVLPKKPESAAARPAPTGTEVGVGITLQVMASRSKSDAEKMMENLKGRGYPVFVVTPEYAKAGDNLYRVQVGPFRSVEEAEKVRAKLVQEGLKPFIRR